KLHATACGSPEPGRVGNRMPEKGGGCRPVVLYSRRDPRTLGLGSGGLGQANGHSQKQPRSRTNPAAWRRLPELQAGSALAARRQREHTEAEQGRGPGGGNDGEAARARDGVAGGHGEAELALNR